MSTMLVSPVVALLRFCTLWSCLILCVGYRLGGTKSPGYGTFRSRVTAMSFQKPRRGDTSIYHPPSIYKVEEDPLVPIIETAIKIADFRKARQMAAFRISHLTSITTFVVIIEGIMLVAL